jgi:hypothetical protein
MYIYTYTYIYICIHEYIYIYMYIYMCLGVSIDEPALCLICGQVLHAGMRGGGSKNDATPPGIGMYM